MVLNQARTFNEGTLLFCVYAIQMLLVNGSSLSQWSHWTGCSRTCGDGVRQRTRFCRNRFITNGSSPGCIGNRTEFHICLQNDCASSDEEFLKSQCSKRNGQVYAGKKVEKWFPFQHGSNPCELQCRSTDKSLVYSFGKVTDGTKCPTSSPADASLCINGRCMALDCAHQIGSDNRRDRCGVCRGDNSTCVLNRKTVWKQPRPNIENRKDRHYDYNEMFTVPAGAAHISISEATDNNFLALMDDKQNYLVNGNWRIQNPEHFIAMATKFVYTRTLDGKEDIFAEGPIPFPLTVLVLGFGDLPTIQYQYWTSSLTNLNFEPLQKPSFKKLYSNPQKQAYHTKISVPLNNEIETVLKWPTKHASVTKSSGFRSFYHRNEILKSVPSWSYKRHINRKHKTVSIHPTEQNKPADKMANRTTANDHRHFENAKTDEPPSKPIVHIPTASNASRVLQAKRLAYSSSAPETKNFANGGRPNGRTSSFTRPHHILPEQQELRSRIENTHNTTPKSESDDSFPKNNREKHPQKLKTKRKRKTVNGVCPRCPKVKHQTRNFCSSDFVLRAVVLTIEKHIGSVRYELEVIRSYKNKVPILSKEYMWTPEYCTCPKLRIGKEYILMGYSVIRSRESQLVLDRNSFVRQYTAKRDRSLLKLIRDQSIKCR